MARRTTTPSSGARAAGQTTIATMFSACTTDFSKEVGKTVEVKGDWWVGGTAAERRAWHLVKIIDYAPSHQFEVTRKGQPTTHRTGKALKIRVVEKGEDDDEDAWMDVMQYQKYRVRYDEKLKGDAIVEKARGLLETAAKAAADGDDQAGARAADDGGDAGGGADAVAAMSDKEKKARYKSVVALLYKDMTVYRPAKSGKSGSWKFKCLLDNEELWEPSAKDKPPTGTSRRSKHIREKHPRVWLEFIVPLSPHVRGRVIDGTYVKLMSFKEAFHLNWLFAKMIAADRRPTSMGRTRAFESVRACLAVQRVVPLREK